MAVRRFSKQDGFTLIELMIALLLGLLLSGAIISVFLEGKNNFVQDDEVARVQENGRYAIRLLSREIGMAGFFGGEPDAVDVNGHEDGFAFDNADECGPNGKSWLLFGSTVNDGSVDHIASPLEVLDAADDTADDYFRCLTDGLVVDATDILVVKRASDTAVIVDGEWQAPITALDANRYYLWTSNRGQGSTILKQGSAFSSGDLAGIISTDSGSDVWEYKAAIFYVGTDADVPSLCKKELEDSGGGISAQRCLLQGVENIQYELGVDVDGDEVADQYISNDSYPPVVGGEDADGIVSVRVHVLVRSINEIRSMPAVSKSYRLGGGTTVTTPTDQYYRMVMSTTVSIRNPTSIGGT
ncbi:PilW family protein [Porticoccus sp.]